MFVQTGEAPGLPLSWLLNLFCRYLLEPLGREVLSLVRKSKGKKKPHTNTPIYIYIYDDISEVRTHEPSVLSLMRYMLYSVR